jgi:peptidoglycan hydrolase CwlO-like protein
MLRRDMKLLILSTVLSFPLFAQTDFGYLKAEDQKYYKNEPFEGNNQMERIDSLVKEINKLHAEMATLKNDVKQLKADMEVLKKKP